MAADSHRALLGAERSGISRLNGDSTPVRVGRWVGLRRGHSLGMNARVSPVHLQTPGTTSVSSVPGLSAPAATLSSTGASTLERSPCSECGGGSMGGKVGLWVGAGELPWGSQDGLKHCPSLRCPWLRCEICGFTCRQKASLNWHRRKHAETAATLRFPCEFCGKRFEKPDSVAAHCSKSHPALLPAPQESPGPLEPCPNISASVTLRSDDESRPSLVPEALTTLHQQ